MPDFLLEIGAEEIPDSMIQSALEDLRARYEAAFSSFGGSAIVVDGTPRRLVLIAKDILAQESDTQTVLQGPYLSAGPKAAEGFARKQGAAVEQLAKISDAKGERYAFHQLSKGQSATEALSAKLPAVIAGIHFPKTMCWTSKNGVRFIRPIRWIIALLDDQIVDFEIAGVKSGNLTRGHRILGSKEPFLVTIGTYFDVLKKNGVIVHAEERRKRIEESLGPDVEPDDDLLNTLVYLTEFPSVIRGRFDPSYLTLPKEILSTVMRHHQKYFSVQMADGSLASEFVAVTNTDGDPDGLIRQGNERVLRARFNDARFFWNSDQRKSLADRLPDLEKVTFQAQLGSYKDKTDRVVQLAKQLAGVNDAIERAGLLSKCDLTTDMVKEFPELQGVVGGLYACAQSEPEGVATAIYDHYKPVNLADSIPRTFEGQIVSIADKLDTLIECFRIGLVPTGSKDPFALRRAAQGLVKIVVDTNLRIDLWNYVSDDQLRFFILDRLHHYLVFAKAITEPFVRAAIGTQGGSIADISDVALALESMRGSEDLMALAASFKRIKNILRQAGFNSPQPIDENLLAPGPERDLYHAFLQVRQTAAASHSYRDKLFAIASLRPQVDLFFDKILVNDPNPATRQNRLALLYSVLTEFSNIADFSEIVTQA